MGFQVWGLGFGVWGPVFGAQGFGFWVQGLGTYWSWVMPYQHFQASPRIFRIQKVPRDLEFRVGVEDLGAEGKGFGTVLNLRTTASHECESVPRRACI